MTNQLTLLPESDPEAVYRRNLESGTLSRCNLEKCLEVTEDGLSGSPPFFPLCNLCDCDWRV